MVGSDKVCIYINTSMKKDNLFENFLGTSNYYTSENKKKILNSICV